MTYRKIPPTLRDPDQKIPYFIGTSKQRVRSFGVLLAKLNYFFFNPSLTYFLELTTIGDADNTVRLPETKN